MHRLTILDDKGCANVIYGELSALAERVGFCHYYPGAAHPVSRRTTVSVEIYGPVSGEIPGHQLPHERQATEAYTARVHLNDAAADLLAACERSLERCAVSDEWTDIWAARGHQWAMDRKAMREAVKKARGI